MTQVQRITFVALAVGILAAPAFAVPISPFNTRPVVVGGSGGEIPLQTMVNSILGPGLNVNTDQSTAAMWSVATFPPSTIPTLAFEQSGGAAGQVFGMWFGTDTLAIYEVDLLRGPAVPGTAAGISWSGPGYNTLDVFATPANCVAAVNCGSFTNALVNPYGFGFYIKTFGSTFYSSDMLNGPPRPDRMLAFERGTNWAIAFEDGTDFDYNDMVVKIESIEAIPEPGTLLLIGSGLAGLAMRRRRRS